jgi:hypothetical protein
MMDTVADLIVDLREIAVDPISDPLVRLWGVPESEVMDKVMALVALAPFAGGKVRVITGSLWVGEVLDHIKQARANSNEKTRADAMRAMRYSAVGWNWRSANPTCW